MDPLAAVLANISRIRQVEDGPGAGPLASVCVVAPPATLDHVQAFWAGGNELPTELLRFWRLADGARLFEDPDYGQWGLVLLSVAASRQRTQAEFEVRPDDMESGDVVVGEFLGDQELLVYSADEGVLVALPLDSRGDWYRAAPTLTDFLERYTAALGEKFWESNS